MVELERKINKWSYICSVKPVKYFLLVLFSFVTFCISAQDTTDLHGTIKIEKRGTLHSVIYDDVNFRLICMDTYGNINDTAVVSFEVRTAIKGIAYSEQTAGCFLSRPLQQKLSRLDNMVVLMFSDVKAKDKYGNIVTFPDFKAQTGSEREKDDY